jgi:AraC-like DNA-binding protein
MPPHQTHVIRHDSAFGEWEVAVGRPSPSLSPHVAEYTGWIEQRFTPGVRRELPGNVIPFIVNFGSPYRLADAAQPGRWQELASFTTGAYDRTVLVAATGPAGGVQVNFTILGARLFFGRPIGELANLAVSLEDMLGPAAGVLAERLYEAPDWEARFAIVDREIAVRLNAATALPEAVTWAWRRLTDSGGRVRIGDIVGELGCSQRYLIEKFTAQFGLSPKVLGRVLRFGTAVRLIERGGGAHSLADIAHRCGYYDQSHFCREAALLAGTTPSELVASLVPDRGGFAAQPSASVVGPGL